MPKLNRSEYTAEELARHDAAYNRLKKMIWPDAAAAGEFRRELEKALASGFPADWPGKDGWTLLHEAVAWKDSVRAGLPQVLIDAGADVNARTADGDTPLERACWGYVWDGGPEYLTLINILLAAGARPELDKSWQIYCDDGEQRARRDRLKAYITAWNERRAERDRAQDAAPAFDYSL